MDNCTLDIYGEGVLAPAIRKAIESPVSPAGSGYVVGSITKTVCGP